MASLDQSLPSEPLDELGEGCLRRAAELGLALMNHVDDDRAGDTGELET